MEMTSSTLVISPECLADIGQLNDYQNYGYPERLLEDDTLWFDDLDPCEEYDPFSNELLAVLHKHKVNGCIKFYQGPSNYGRADSFEFGYEFEDGIRYELETVVTWRRKEST